LLLGREERTGGREKQSLLADALERWWPRVPLRGLQSALELLDRLLAPSSTRHLGLLGGLQTELQEKLQGAHRRPSTRSWMRPVRSMPDLQVEVQFQG